MKNTRHCSNKPAGFAGSVCTFAGMNGQWNFMRLLRGGVALWAFWEVYRTGEWMLLVPGVIFGIQAVLNVGCCGSTGCSAPPTRQTAKNVDTKPVTYEEVR